MEIRQSADVNVKKYHGIIRNYQTGQNIKYLYITAHIIFFFIYNAPNIEVIFFRVYFMFIVNQNLECTFQTCDN